MTSLDARLSQDSIDKINYFLLLFQNKLNAETAIEERKVVDQYPTLFLVRDGDTAMPSELGDATILENSAQPQQKVSRHFMVAFTEESLTTNKNELLREVRLNGYQKVLEIIKAGNIDVNSPLDKRNNTALHIAARYCNERMIHLLINLGANPKRPYKVLCK